MSQGEQAIIIRTARPADAPAVSRVLHDCYSSLYRGWYTDEALEAALPAMTRANPSLLASGRYYVAEEDGRIVACGGWSAQGPNGGGAPHLAHARHFATEPRSVNRGHGGAILARALAEASTEGFAEMEVVASLAAEAFYARHGFLQIAMVRQPMGGVGFACVLMRRNLENGHENARHRV